MIDAVTNGFSFEFLVIAGTAVGLCMIFILAWCFMVTITAAIEIHRKRDRSFKEIIQSVRQAIQPLLDEF